jgi:uncharacterized protein YbjT (DUF2867 family)
MQTNQITNTIAVIGATGKTGARVSTLLKQAGLEVRELSRSSQPSFDWHQPDHWREALAGCSAAYVTYQPDLAVPQAQGHIQQLVRTAKAVGLEHLVLLSGRGEDGAQLAEQEIKTSGLTWNIVRASWFMQNFSESFMADGIANRHLVLPHANALEPFIDVDDIAEVAAAALTRPELHNKLFEITGPDLLSFQQCVDYISAAIDEPVTLQHVPVEAYLAEAEKENLPEGFGWLINELFTVVLDGRNEFTTHTIEQVLGRKPRSFHQYVAKCMADQCWPTATDEVAP